MCLCMYPNRIIAPSIKPLFFTVVLLLLSKSRAEEFAIVDHFMQRKPSDGRHFISFCATDHGKVGHAFLLLSAYDDRKQACATVAAIGFWPESGKKNSLVSVFSGVPGSLKDEIQNSKRDQSDIVNANYCRLTVPITPDEFEILKLKIGAFAEKDYQLIANDCVTLCEEVAHDILKLETPNRQKLFEKMRAGGFADKLPVLFVQELAAKNGRNPK